MHATMKNTPHGGPNVDDLVFDLSRAANGNQKAHDLGAALCDLETAVSRQPSISALEHDRLAKAFAGATAAALRMPSSIRYTDDIALGISATFRLLARWRAGMSKPFADGLQSDIRIFRNALHNADLRLQRRERELLDPQQKTLRIIDEILAPIQHLLSPPTDTKVIPFRSKTPHSGGD